MSNVLQVHNPLNLTRLKRMSDSSSQHFYQWKNFPILTMCNFKVCLCSTPAKAMTEIWIMKMANEVHEWHWKKLLPDEETLWLDEPTLVSDYQLVNRSGGEWGRLWQRLINIKNTWLCHNGNTCWSLLYHHFSGGTVMHFSATLTTLLTLLSPFHLSGYQHYWSNLFPTHCIQMAHCIIA